MCLVLLPVPTFASALLTCVLPYWQLLLKRCRWVHTMQPVDGHLPHFKTPYIFYTFFPFTLTLSLHFLHYISPYHFKSWRSIQFLPAVPKWLKIAALTHCIFNIPVWHNDHWYTLTFFHVWYLGSSQVSLRLGGQCEGCSFKVRNARVSAFPPTGTCSFCQTCTCTNISLRETKHHLIKNPQKIPSDKTLTQNSQDKARRKK